MIKRLVKKFRMHIQPDKLLGKSLHFFSQCRHAQSQWLQTAAIMAAAAVERN